MSVTTEMDLSRMPKGIGLWDRQPVRLTDWVEASANISIAGPYAGLNVRGLLFNATAGTADVAYTQCVLPQQFKEQLQTSDPQLLMNITAGTFSLNQVAVNNTLQLQVRRVFKPGPTAPDRTEIVIDYLGFALGNTVVTDPPTNYGRNFTINLLQGFTYAQRRNVVRGSVMEVLIRPNGTVGTNVAMFVHGTEFLFRRHSRFDVPTLTTLA
jgi:hypothetical protein